MAGRANPWRWLAAAAAVALCAPALAQVAAQQKPAAAAQQPAKPAPRGAFGLSPEQLAQLQRLAAQARALAQQAAGQTPAGKPPPAAAAQLPAGPAPAPAGQPAQLGGPPPLRGPQAGGPAGPPPGGVDWRGALVAQRRGGDLSASPERLGLDLAAVNRTAVPILLLRGAPFAKAKIYSFGDQYTISAHLDGARISLTGTTAIVPAPGLKLAAPVEPDGLVVQRTVDGQLASFTRFGVLYTTELRCDAPDDARCQNDAVLRDLVARNTVVVLGKAARRAAGLGG